MKNTNREVVRTFGEIKIYKDFLDRIIEEKIPSDVVHQELLNMGLTEELIDWTPSPWENDNGEIVNDGDFYLGGYWSDGAINIAYEYEEPVYWHREGDWD